ncbi:oligosaccharide flippase family protein [Halorubrum trueperi]|uniref:Oligosaccharide flippase family protein n=1 Tax=Halorubrum trueperi TaxID=2004704 RepID=A0ABD5UMH9_9EURY
MSIADRISRGVSASLGANLLDTLANSLLIVVLARFLLTPAEYGLLFYALSVVGGIAVFGALGIPSSAGRYVTEYGEVDRDQVRHVIRSALSYLLVLSAIVGIGLSAGSGRIAAALNEPGLAPILALGAGYVIFESLRTLVGSVFQGLNRVDLSALVAAVSAVARFVLVVALVGLGLGAVGAFLGYVLGFAVATAVGGTMLYRRFYRTYDPTVPRADGLVRRLLEYSVPLTATRGASVLNKRVDTILVGMLIGPLAVAYYTVGKQVSQVAVTPATSLGATISPTVGEQSAGNQRSRAARIYERSFEAIVILYVPAAVGLFLVAGPLVRQVFGVDYGGAVPVVQAFSLYVLLNAISRITSDALDFLGRARERAIVKTAMAVTNLGLNLLFIPAFGVVGAAIATVITHAVYVGANVVIISRELPVSFDRVARSAAHVTVLSALMGAGVAASLPLVSGIPSLVAVVALGVAIWAALSVASGLVNPDEIRGYFA